MNITEAHVMWSDTELTSATQVSDASTQTNSIELTFQHTEVKEYKPS